MMLGIKERNISLVDGRFYYDFTFGGKRHRGFAGHTRDQARNYVVKLKADLLDIARGFKKPAAAEVSFNTFADKFLRLYSKQNKRSWGRDEISLGHLKEYFGDKRLSDVGAEDIEGYKAKRRGEVSGATVNRELACLRTMFHKAVEWETVENSPFRGVRLFPEPPWRTRVCTPEEERGLIAAASPELQPIIIVAIGTAMRRGEILSLRWTDLDFAQGTISILASKNGKGRKVPMSGAVAAALGGVPHRGEYVFWNSETKTRTKDVKKPWATACGAAGIAGLRFHDLRHTALTRMSQAGVDHATLGQISGNTWEGLKRYCHPSEELARRAVEGIS